LSFAFCFFVLLRGGYYPQLAALPLLFGCGSTPASSLLVEARGLRSRAAEAVDLVLEAVAVVHVLEEVERLCASLLAPEAAAGLAGGAVGAHLVSPSPLLTLLVVVRAGDAAAGQRRGHWERERHLGWVESRRLEELVGRMDGLMVWGRDLLPREVAMSNFEGLSWKRVASSYLEVMSKKKSHQLFQPSRCIHHRSQLSHLTPQPARKIVAAKKCRVLWLALRRGRRAWLWDPWIPECGQTRKSARERTNWYLSHAQRSRRHHALWIPSSPAVLCRLSCQARVGLRKGLWS
jgi:hypothetical protein